MSVLRRIQIIQMLLFPDKYKKYDPVAILTANYHEISNPRLSAKDLELHLSQTHFIEKKDDEVIFF